MSVKKIIAVLICLVLLIAAALVIFASSLFSHAENAQKDTDRAFLEKYGVFVEQVKDAEFESAEFIGIYIGVFRYNGNENSMDEKIKFTVDLFDSFEKFCDDDKGIKVIFEDGYIRIDNAVGLRVFTDYQITESDVDEIIDGEYSLILRN